MSSAFDSNGKLALMMRTGTGDPAGNNLCTFRKVSPETGNILIVYLLYFINAKCAYFFPAASVAARLVRLINCQLYYLLTIPRSKRKIVFGEEFLKIFGVAVGIIHVLLTGDSCGLCRFKCRR